ncbi:DUF1491 family protein [Acidomonas methanolica]|uniref:DUF1491 family protein n=1 Tax=Acidomonas methanolica NBRC 104435 TaxID=1231351 RepID=A0A023D2Y4_ACIMT|nr:DUF1491 family protein [Acidomonas methanolica]MBU2654798.1 DUF1491 family protein [Acidomonas methanolica]TCS26463.1 hypothetical protein EDC31_11314 [Acidomonas methanolica]GAJ28434.1 hypothetical protein Amme_023_027 [Acidomonas methanolica NBRC 104435]GBQ51151.1 hypothetical protein AA0498_1397 [Acidomonas methanolica]GEK99211.1 hypothetical protein AME01nite_17100 [Acidomonas methanolica NBRC 104435]
MTARLKAGLWVRALLRQTAMQGHSAMVLRRGDEDAGAVIVVLIDRAGGLAVLREQAAFGEDEAGWTRVEVADQAALDAYLDRQRRYDPDLWVIELEVPAVSDPVEGTLGTRGAA